MMFRIAHLLLAMLLSLPACALAAAAARPNIAVFIMDDVGQTDIGAFGNPAVRTPNIDRLANEGMRFRQAFLTTSSCTASRASILTGRYPHNTGTPELGGSVRADIASLPLLLREHGYYTASVGKWHLGEPFKPHFDKVVDMHEDTGTADWLTELAKRPAGKPFFFWFASLDAHIPYDWHIPQPLPSPATVQIHPWMEDSPYERWLLAQYYYEIERVDGRIGQVVAALRQAGELDNTLIVVLSDNGTMFGGAKTTLYDEGLLTPLVMRYPSRVMAGADNRQLVSSVDLMPTVLALAGVPAPADLPGVSLWPTLVNPQQAVHDFVYAERNKHGPAYFERAIRTRDLLYKRNYDGRRLCDPQDDVLAGKHDRDAKHEEFYHMAKDPLARQDIADDPAFRNDLARLRHTMNQIMQETHDQPPPLLLEACRPRQWQERILLPPSWIH